MPLKLLHHKSYHPYKAENIARVKADEARAREQDEETDRRTMLADSEARLDRLRHNAHKQKKARRKEENEGEKALERQLRGEREDDRSHGRVEEYADGSEIVRPAGWKGKGKEREEQVGPEPVKEGEVRHINFWSEQEAGANPSTSQLARTLEKASKPTPSTSLASDPTKMFFDPPRPGWYASPSLQPADRQDEKIEVTLERAYRDGEHKRMSDPLGVMVGFLKQREEAMSGRGRSGGASEAERVAGWGGRERYATPASRKEDDNFERHVESLLPKHRKGDPLPHPSSAHKASDAWGLSPTSRSSAPPRPPPTSAHAESTTRVSSERERARALLAAKKKSNQTDASSSFGGSTLGGDTPRTERGMGTMYNQQEVRWAAEARERAVGMGGRGYGGGGGGGRGGWADRKTERERRQGGGWGR